MTQLELDNASAEVLSLLKKLASDDNGKIGLIIRQAESRLYVESELRRLNQEVVD
jgi:hypothetical protein